MSNLLLGREPDPTIAPVREFLRHPGFRVMFSNLTELRASMVEDDIVIIYSLAKRVARARVAQNEFIAMNGMRRSYSTNYCLPLVLKEAHRRHPYNKGLLDVVSKTYPIIAEESFAPQLYDFPLIDGMASRLNKAKQAVVFKKDKEEGLAPETQRINIERAMFLAIERLPDDPDFPEYVGRVYGAMVPAMVAVQQTLFPNTYLLDDWDGTNFTPLIV